VKAFVLLLLCAASLLAPAANQASAPTLAVEAPIAAEPFAAAAAALRARDCARGYDELAIAARRDPALAAPAQLLLGLYAHACDDPARAEAALFAVSGGELDDWRLQLLADSAAAAGHQPAAEAALHELLGAHRDSPLWPQALLRALELAAGNDNPAPARELVAAGRAAQLPAEPAARLEALAWQVASKSGDLEEARRAARYLLVRAPLLASDLQVIDVFRGPGATLDWTFLGREERHQRARALLDAGITAGALQTLDAFPPAERDNHWHVERARALTLDHRGGEALALLAGRRGVDPAEDAALEYARAQAALDSATVRRGAKALPSSERARLRLEYRQHLWRVVRLDADRELARPALLELWTELEEEGQFEEAMQALALLRQLDPTDTSGARFLFDLGWGEFRTGNATGAIGTWSRLREFYPEARLARAAQYWTGRAFEKLGERERALAIYRQVAAASANDFYRRHAATRLGGAAPAAAVVTTPWPRGPQWQRAERLSDLGLDALALAELDARVARSPDEATAVPQVALRARVLSRQGSTRESLRLLRQAFPELGGPDQGAAPVEALALFYPRDYSDVIAREASRQAVPVELVFGIVHQESGFDALAVSRSGARGLMQLMPPTARELAKKLGLPYSTARLSEPDFSLRLGTSYLRQVLDMFDGNVELALAGYNSGPYRIQRLWRDAPVRDVDLFVEDLQLDEPRLYVKRILVSSDSYRRLNSGS
jgi:soluble lytic murein transglycosylase